MMCRILNTIQVRSWHLRPISKKLLKLLHFIISLAQIFLIPARQRAWPWIKIQFLVFLWAITKKWSPNFCDKVLLWEMTSLASTLMSACYWATRLQIATNCQEKSEFRYTCKQKVARILPGIFCWNDWIKTNTIHQAAGLALAET